ncbi:iron-siderophore ABC transporter substrate-binding protein [Salibacterium lacus]|uniref:Iron-siderophore ABC transporter substrate-binding protein n=1 Tax=Salibacterium lacus TaxID=1898109 RepID=A0ABW5T437_9BACI
MRKWWLFFLSLVCLIVLGACSSGQSSTSTSGSDAAEDSEQNSETSGTEEEKLEEPIVIEHAFGETVIESKPERVATVQWGNQDVALAMGVMPAGFSAANYGVTNEEGMLPWTEEKVKELGGDPTVYQDTDGLDFEAVSDTNPDVILAAYSGITQEDYDTLSKIAPVVAYPESPWTTPWREQIRMNAKGMAMEEEGEQLIKDTEQLISEKTAEYPEMKGKKVVWANFSADDMSELHLYTPADTRVSFLTEELGMQYPESVKNLIEDESSFSLSLSAENADVLNDADIIIGYGDESLYEAVKADPRLGRIDAIERGSVAFIGDGTALAASGTPTPLSISYTIDDYLGLIGDAISQIDE